MAIDPETSQISTIVEYDDENGVDMAPEVPETPAESINRLDREKVGYHATKETPLKVSADSLTAEIVALRISVTALDRNKGSRLAVIGSYVLWLIDIAIIAFVAVLLHNQSTQNARIETSIHEQCSLYALIIPSYGEASKQRSPLGPAAYDNAYRQMQNSADHLNCGIPHTVPGT